MKRFFVVFIILIVIGLISFSAWLYFRKSGTAETFALVPSDAVFVIESTDMIKGWEELSSSKMWKHLIASNTWYEDVNKNALYLDSLIQNNRSLMSVLDGRQILISAHLLPENDYDFLFAVNIGKASKISFLQDYIIEVARLADYIPSKTKMLDVSVHVLTDKATREPIYLAFIENVLICSFNQQILESSIHQWQSGTSILANAGFEAAGKEISSQRLFNFYFNFGLANDFARVYLSEPPETIEMLSHALLFSAFNFNLEEDLLRLEGFTSVNDSILSYLYSLSQISPGKLRAQDVISDKAAVVMSLGFNEYMDFYSNLEKEFSRQDTGRFDDINKTRKRIERFLKIDLQQDFFSWIGSEITLVKLRPSSLIGEKDAAAFVSTKDINLAKEGMSRIGSQIRKRTPFRFDILNYQGYEINQFEIKGFFKVFFGKMFAGIEKPYYTVIEDYVVFSNSTGLLLQLIDDYTRGNTLSRNKAFSAFRDNFGNKANIQLFIQMPKLYSHLFYFSKEAKREAMKKNRNLILSFSQIGFQMISSDKGFKTSFLAAHNPEAAYDDELERFESAADELYNIEYENRSFAVELPESARLSNSLVKVNFPDTALLHGEGLVKDGKPDGMWRVYYRSGNLHGILNYKNGMLNGQASFFHDNEKQTKRAELVYDDDLISGDYYEFYTTGTRKAMLSYRKGKPDGKAEFYYESGMLRLAGEYKKGGKTGRWLHYTESGQVFDKERWRRDQRKR